LLIIYNAPLNVPEHYQRRKYSTYTRRRFMKKCFGRPHYAVGLIVVGILCFSGCRQITDEPQIAISAAPSRLSQTYKNITGLQLSYAQKGVDLVQEYVELPISDDARGASAAALDFSDIGGEPWIPGLSRPT
jgi:hypothetical protein